MERFSIKITFWDFIDYQNKHKLKDTEIIVEYIHEKNTIVNKGPLAVKDEKN